VETIGSKWSYALIWCMPNNDDDDDDDDDMVDMMCNIECESNCLLCYRSVNRPLSLILILRQTASTLTSLHSLVSDWSGRRSYLSGQTCFVFPFCHISQMLG